MNINITKTARVCIACEKTFVHEEELHSLVRIQDQMLQREDYCASCWEPGRAKEAYSAWSPQFYDPAVAEQEAPEVYSPLRETFYAAVESEDRKELAMAYLAAQLLRRQKVFRLIKETEDFDEEMKLSLFTDRIGERMIEVRDPNLSHAELEQGRQLLMARLDAIENPPEEQPPEDEAEGEETSPHAEESQPTPED